MPSDSSNPVDSGALLKSEERLKYLVALNDALRPLRDPIEIQDVGTRLLAGYLRVNRVIYAEIDGDDYIVTRSHINGVAPVAGRGPIATFGKALVDAYRRGETVAVNDIRTDPRFTETEAAGLLSNEIAAFVGVMLHKGGQWLAAFGVHSATPRVWTHDEIAVVEETGERTWAAAERARAEDALRTSEERQAFLLRLNDALQPLSDPLDVQETAARLLGEHLQVNRVGYAEVVEGRGYVIRREYTHGVASLIGGPRGLLLGEQLRDAFRRGETVVVN